MTIVGGLRCPGAGSTRTSVHVLLDPEEAPSVRLPPSGPSRLGLEEQAHGGDGGLDLVGPEGVVVGHVLEPAGGLRRLGGLGPEEADQASCATSVNRSEAQISFSTPAKAARAVSRALSASSVVTAASIASGPQPGWPWRLPSARHCMRWCPQRPASMSARYLAEARAASSAFFWASSAFLGAVRNNGVYV